MRSKILLITLLATVLIGNAYAQHPWMIKDVNATGTKNGTVGSAGSSINSGLKQMYSANGYAFFIANDGVHGAEMWRTDGTATGTIMLADITAGAGSTSFSGIYEAGNLLYFQTFDSSNKVTLWRSDGTTAGTFSIMSNVGGHSIHGGGDLTNVNDGFSNYSTVSGNDYYFIVTDDLGQGTLSNGSTYENVHDRIYKTDGTVAGTSVYYDSGITINTAPLQGAVSVGLVYGRVDKIIACAGKIYVVGVNNIPYATYNPAVNGANDNSTYIQTPTLSVGDGTSAPTLLYSPPNVMTGKGISNVSMVNVNNNYLLMQYSIDLGSSLNLYRLKPSESTPVLIEAIGSAGLSNLSFLSVGFNLFTSSDYSIGSLYFYRDINGGKAVTNGEVAGTFELSGMTNTLASYTGMVNGKMTFYNEGDTKVYAWDGATPTSYQVVSDSLTGKNIDRVVQAGNRVFYFNQQYNPVKVSDLSGSNCFSVYPGYFSDRGAVLNNNYIDFIRQADGSFDAGIEPALLNSTFKIFTGAVSNDWNTAGNWLPNGVPAATDDVVIPALKSTSYPVISANATCHNITMNQSLLTVNTGVNLDINGYVAKYRASMLGLGAVTLKGTATTLYGTYTGGSSVANLFDVANVNISGTDVSLATATQTVNSAVTFQTDNKIIAPYTALTFTKKPYVTGYNSNRYIITGNGNLITYNGVGSATTADSLFTIPVGTTTTSYTPASFGYKFNDSPSIGVTLTDGISRNGLTGPAITAGVLNKKWTFSAPTSSTNNIRVTLGWSNTADELTGFNRAASFVDRFLSPIWSPGSTQAAALNNSLYTVTQNLPVTTLNGQFIVSSDAGLSPTLSSLAISQGTLSPSFASSTLNYSVAVTTPTISFAPIVSAGATIKVNGVALTPLPNTATVALAVGANVIPIVVTSSDGSTSTTYNVTVTRTPSNISTLSYVYFPAITVTHNFAVNELSYSVIVPSASTNITVGTTDAGATILINGVAAISGGMSPVNLAFGVNSIPVRVTSGDGTTTTTYTLNITRPFSPPIISYAGPQTYTVTTTISPLTPANAGGPVPATVYGQVSTFAGSGTAGSTNGTGIGASNRIAGSYYFSYQITCLIGNI